MHRISWRVLLFLLAVCWLPCPCASSLSSSATTATRSTTGSVGDDVPSWDELDRRPLPTWYDEAKFGIFIHWGVFSVPSFGNEWFWKSWTSGAKYYEDFVRATERPNFAYEDYAQRFTAELFHPEQWAKIFAASGAQYVVPTSKHHDGFCNWNSTTAVPTTWNWNSVDVGPKRDLIGELSRAVKATVSPFTDKNITFGVYHSLFEWFNPLYLKDKKNGWKTQDFVDTKTVAELYDLVNRYEPEIVWSDGAWEAPSSYWKSREFLYWYGTNSTVAKTAVWNDRWGSDTQCKHGLTLTCRDKYLPDLLFKRKWVDCLTIDKTSWGLNRAATFDQYLTVKEIIDTLIQVVAYNGNMLLNVGPAADGTIHPIFVDRLMGVGDWLRVNGAAIYATKPWVVCQHEESASVFYTTKRNSLYAHFTKWPTGNELSLDCPVVTDKTTVRMLGVEDSHVDSRGGPVIEPATTMASVGGGDGSRSGWLTWTGLHEFHPNSLGGIIVKLPILTPDLIPCQHAWVLELTGLGNLVFDE